MAMGASAVDASGSAPFHGNGSEYMPTDNSPIRSASSIYGSICRRAPFASSSLWPGMLSSPWILLAPSIVAVLAITGFNLLGRALEETLETRR